MRFDFLSLCLSISNSISFYILASIWFFFFLFIYFVGPLKFLVGLGWRYKYQIRCYLQCKELCTWIEIAWVSSQIQRFFFISFFLVIYCIEYKYWYIFLFVWWWISLEIYCFSFFCFFVLWPGSSFFGLFPIGQWSCSRLTGLVYFCLFICTCGMRRSRRMFGLTLSY